MSHLLVTRKALQMIEFLLNSRLTERKNVVCIRNHLIVIMEFYHFMEYRQMNQLFKCIMFFFIKLKNKLETLFEIYEKQNKQKIVH